MTPCEPSDSSPWGFKRKLGSQVAATISATSLAGIELGRQFRDGKLIEMPFGAHAERRITFRFDPADAQETFLNSLGLHRSVNPISQFRDFDKLDSAIKVIDGAEINSRNGRAFARPTTVVLAELEIIRFYYVISEKLGLCVFNNLFEPDQRAKLIYQKHGGVFFMDDTPGDGRRRARMEYRLGFRDDDVPILARILLDPSALSGAQRVNRSMIAQEIRAPGSRWHPRTLFPFAQSADIEVEGRFVAIAGRGEVFLASRITACNGPFPFDELSSQCEVDPHGRLKSAPPGAPPAFKNQPPRNVPGDPEAGEVRSDQRPDRNSEPSVSKPEARRLSGLDKVVLKFHDKFRPNTHVAAPDQKLPTKKPLHNSSTGDPTSGNSSTQKQEMADEIDAGPPPVDLESFVALLAQLRSLQPQWFIQTVGLSGRWRSNSDHEIYSRFPEVECAKKKSVLRQFSFLDKDKTQRRRLLCANVACGEKHVYLMEAERRLNPAGSYMEELPILLVWRSPFPSQVAEEDLQKILVRTVTNPSKTWPRELRDLNLSRATLDHKRSKDQSAEATRLAGAIERAIL